MKVRALLTVGVVGLCCAPAFAATPAAPAGPWNRVPALPTACYTGQDQWLDKNSAAIDAVRETLDAQKEANTAVEEKVGSAMSDNPMAASQALQQAMLEDPANAQKMIEKMVQTGQQAQTELPAQSEKEAQLEAESKSLVSQYNAALEKAMQPAVSRWTAMQKKMGWSVDPTIALMPDPSWPRSAWQEWAGIQKDRDAAYVANCARWWSATGPFQVYMRRYKDYLVNERIPFEKKTFDEPKLDNFKMLRVPADGWRTTTDFEAAIDYMKMASTLYGKREWQPLCRKENACQ